MIALAKAIFLDVSDTVLAKMKMNISSKMELTSISANNPPVSDSREKT
jgi:hypothetical protein